MTGPRQSLADLVAATPASRERYVDFLRAASILVVVLGHWTIAVVTVQGSQVVVGNLIAQVRGMWIGTWVLQVMPVFFFVGGFANLVSLDAIKRRGGSYAAFAAGRVRRLLRPVAVLLGVWIPIALVLQATGIVPRDRLAPATQVVTQLLWFVGVYLLVVALAPPMLALHRRFGTAVPIAVALGCALVDVLRFGAGVPWIGFGNFAFVWLFAHQLGFFYAESRLGALPRSALVAAALGGLGALWALTRFGPYPLSMVGLPGDATSNMNPPSLCLVALSVWQVALVMLLRDAATRWLQNPRAWGLVIAVNGVIMTILLWHLSAMLVALAVLLPAGFPQASVGTTTWWLLKLAWIVIFAAITAGLVALLGRFERPQERAPDEAAVSALSASLGMALVVAGTCGFAISGLIDFVNPGSRRLIVIPVSPLVNLSLLAAGLLALGILRRRPPAT